MAPGVFIEEQSFRGKAIEGVDTSTAGFVGPCRYGPVAGAPALLNSLADFERVHGDGQDLDFGGGDGAATSNFLWHAVRAFFEQGGRRLFVSRLFCPLAGDAPRDPATSSPADPPHADGHARGRVGGVRLLACHPGAAGNLQVRIGLRLDAPSAAWEGLVDGDVVWVAAPGPVGDARDLPLGIARRDADGVWRVNGSESAAPGLQRLTLGVEALAADGRPLASWTGLSLDPASAAGPVRLLADGRTDGLALVRELMAGMAVRPSRAELAAAGGDTRLAWRLKLERGLGFVARLTGGNDGLPPTPLAYPGQDHPPTGLKALAAVDVAIVAAPGAGGLRSSADISAVNAALVAHAEQLRHRIALLDPPPALSPAAVGDFRRGLDSRQAALYYPWVTITHPGDGQALNLPPSGLLAGVYARVDAERGVWKAPANEVLRGVTGLERELRSAEQEALNPAGVNVLRRFEGRGLRVWGARTLSSDAEWKYVNLQRYFAYLEHSIERGTQWAVFEPNGEALWMSVRAAVSDFLLAEWRRGALLGDRPEQAFFVRCDRSVMTQQDLDQGRLVAMVGAAMLKPAEFIVFRIGQWTADRP